MALFSKRLQDTFFGQLTFMKMREPEDSYWEGSRRFEPAGGDIEVFVDADESGPSEAQREFFREVERRYRQVLAESRPLLERQWKEWRREPAARDLPNLLPTSISIPRLDDGPPAWEIGLTLEDGASVSLLLAMEGWTPVRVDFDT